MASEQSLGVTLRLSRQHIAQSARPDREWLEKCQQGGPRIGSSSEGRHLKLKLVRRIKAGSHAARDRCFAFQSAGKTQKFMPFRNSFVNSSLFFTSLLYLS